MSFFILPIVSIILFLGIVVSNTKKSRKTISIVDQKIQDFKNKTFSFPDEREIAKKQLIEELIKIKENYSTNHVGRGYLKMADSIMTKISLL
jgi:hypothetical protein